MNTYSFDGLVGTFSTALCASVASYLDDIVSIIGVVCTLIVAITTCVVQCYNMWKNKNTDDADDTVDDVNEILDSAKKYTDDDDDGGDDDGETT